MQSYYPIDYLRNTQIEGCPISAILYTKEIFVISKRSYRHPNMTSMTEKILIRLF